MLDCPIFHKYNNIYMVEISHAKGEAMKPNHHSLAYKRQVAPNKTYKDLKQKQKAKIADYMYRETLRFYSKNARMPNESECDNICRTVYQKIEGMVIWVPYDDVLKQLLKKQSDYEPRIFADVENGITEKSLEKPKKSVSIEKDKKVRKKKKRVKEEIELSSQDDRFFFIAGYTSGGAPYGVTWEEMGLEPYESIDEIE